MNDSIRISNLEENLGNLSHKLDSLSTLNSLEQIKYELNDRHDIITNVNDFYDSAWLKLILVISILGVIVPIIVQYLQRKNLKDLTESIRKQMNDSFDSRISELKDFNEREMKLLINEFKEKITQVEKENKNLLKELDASTFYLQGRAQANENTHTVACFSFVKSSMLWLSSSRPERVKVTLVNLVTSLGNLNSKKSIEMIGTQLSKTDSVDSIDAFITLLKSDENLESYSDELTKVENQLDRINDL